MDFSKMTEEQKRFKYLEHQESGYKLLTSDEEDELRSDLIKNLKICPYGTMNPYRFDREEFTKIIDYYDVIEKDNNEFLDSEDEIPIKSKLEIKKFKNLRILFENGIKIPNLCDYKNLEVIMWRYGLNEYDIKDILNIKNLKQIISCGTMEQHIWERISKELYSLELTANSSDGKFYRDTSKFHSEIKESPFLYRIYDDYDRQFNDRTKSDPQLKTNDYQYEYMKSVNIHI